MSRILIYEPHIGGHHNEYIEHLVEHGANFQGEIVYLLHPRYEEHKQLKRSLSDRKNQIFVKIQKGQLPNDRPTLVASKKHWDILSEYATQYSVDHAIVMILNIIQYSLGLPWVRYRYSFDVSGILFAPYTAINMEENNVIDKTLEKTRKYLQLLWATSNSSVKNIFVLNDTRAANSLSDKAFHRATFDVLPDPVPKINYERSRPSIKKIYNIKSSKKILLLFGSIRENKGVIKLLRSLRNVSKETLDKAALIIAGKVRSGIRNKMEREVRRLDQNINISIDNRFIPKATMYALFEQCDIVLLPYQRPEASSGILGHAARAKRPVIGSNQGFLGRAIEKYQLGNTANCRNTSDLSQAIVNAIENGVSINESMARKYVNERRPEKFVSKLLPDTRHPVSGGN